MVSWNVQSVSSGLNTLNQHISELEEWDAILWQELFFLRRSSQMWISWRLHLEATKW